MLDSDSKSNMLKNHNPKILTIVGPTASGKSDLAVQIARKYNGEIISADSRQVYKGLNIGTGKITKKEMMGIPHYLLNVADPKKQFTVTLYKKLADEAIVKIIAKNKLPILCGGTGFYIDTVVKNITLPDVPPNHSLRKTLAKKSAIEIFKILQKLDPKRANQIDPKNSLRMIRAIEIAKALGQVPKTESEAKYESLEIGIKIERAVLKEKIKARLIARLKKGMISEAKKLHQEGLSWKRMDELGLEYRYLGLYLQNKISRTEFIEKLNTQIWHYARRQIQWFKMNKKIKWFALTEKTKIDRAIRKFLK